MELIKIKADHYVLEADKEKNQVYFKLFGDIPSVNEISRFESDWMSTIDNLQKGFTILADLREMKPLPPDVAQLNQEIQGQLMQRGCKKVAQVASLDVVVEVNKMAEKNGLKEILRGFSLTSTVERWLAK